MGSWTLGHSRRSSSRALEKRLITAMLVGVAKVALCAPVEMPGSLTDKNVAHSVGEATQRWDVEYLGHGESPVYADGSNWRFRARDRATGATRTFRSGTETGYFVLARTYESLALIGADVGSGVWGFTVYDLEAERKVVEFWGAFPHLSPDNRYLVYRKVQRRRQFFDPTTKIVDFGQELNGLEVATATASQGIGEVVFPRSPTAGRSELDGAYGSVVTVSEFDHVAWDMDNGTFYFTATDRTGHLNLVVLGVAAAKVACYVPLTTGKLRSEYLEVKRVTPTGLALQSAGTVVVTTLNGFGVRSVHEIALREACWEQSQEFAESLDRSGQR